LNSLAINSTLNNRLHAFAKAGTLLANYLANSNEVATGAGLDWNSRIATALQKAEQSNSWFTVDNLHYCIHQWSLLLTEDALEKWLKAYKFTDKQPKNVAVIAAGNVPLVGLHDILCVLLTGNNVLIKASSNDTVLVKLIMDMATSHDATLEQAIHYVEGKLEGFDAVIATGSNNTARYFEYYFGKKPNIIRKNRNSVAVLTGKETPEELEALSDDVFKYFGLGCRSVSHLKVPAGYNFDAFFNGMYKQRELINFVKYANNYDYNKAVYLMSRFELLDNEFLIIKEETTSYSSPIASLGYSFYEQLEDVVEELKSNSEKLQCVVATAPASKKLLEAFQGLPAPDVCGFGTTQLPALSDYADGVDTVKFLLTLS
jgi:hypothetical protein